MEILQGLYRHSLALLTDLYQLTMAYGYWKLGMLDHQAVFSLHFRDHPFHGGFTIAAGLAYLIDYVQHFHVTDDELAYLRTVTGNNGQPIFETAFLDYLRTLRFTCDIAAIPEGTAVFPHEPLVRVQGPLLECQLLETPALNLINFQTLIATKAARICLAARGDPVIEFGLRRAQGIDGGLSATRASFIGGCTSTSDVLGGKLFGIPAKGTHAHSWVMAFDSERESFEAYATAMPNNCIFLVDTYNSLDGVRHAVAVGQQLRAQGHELIGIRLDSGDLAYLSIEARKILDEGGFPKAVIVASSDLDEYIIDSLKEQGAKANVWGVGTRMVTGYDQPALGGVYKLAAIRKPGGTWQHTLKLSEQVVKINTPGILQVRRFATDDGFVADMIYDELLDIEHHHVIIDPADSTRRKYLSPELPWEELLVPVFQHGNLVYEGPPLEAIRQRAQAQLAGLHPGITRLVNPHRYPAGLEQQLHELKMRMILAARGMSETGGWQRS